ncbi:MAG TPA: hypothetical protein VM284_07540 [Candidatus Limnocylindria bacterium]|nr:hypothetical protein [Candidatus Limnocylindria bacterium]
MLLNDIYYEAGELEAKSADKTSWAHPDGATQAMPKRRGPRSIVGHALMALGRAIAAEPTPTTARLRAR